MIGFLANRRHTRLRELLSAYIDGEVSASESLEVREHLATCEACTEEMETLRFTVDLLRELPQLEPMRSYAIETPPEPIRSVGTFGWTARLATSIAALLLVALLAGDMTGILVQQSAIDSSADFSSVAPAAPAPAPAAMAAPAAPAPAPVAALAAPEIAPTSAAAPAAPEVAPAPVAAPAAPAPAPAPMAVPVAPEPAPASAPAPPPASKAAPAAPAPALAARAEPVEEQLETAPVVEAVAEREVEMQAAASEAPVEPRALAAPVAPPELESAEASQAGAPEAVAMQAEPRPAEALVTPTADEDAAVEQRELIVARTPAPADAELPSDDTRTLVAPAPVSEPVSEPAQPKAVAEDLPVVAPVAEGSAVAPGVQEPSAAPSAELEGTFDAGEDGLALPLRQFEIAAGTLLVVLALVSVWVALRRPSGAIL